MTSRSGALGGFNSLFCIPAVEAGRLSRIAVAVPRAFLFRILTDRRTCTLGATELCLIRFHGFYTTVELMVLRGLSSVEQNGCIGFVVGFSSVIHSGYPACVWTLLRPLSFQLEELGGVYQ